MIQRYLKGGLDRDRAQAFFPANYHKSCQYVSAEILHDDGSLGSEFSCDEPVTIRLRFEIREFVPMERLVFTNIAVDAADKPIIEGLTEVRFADEGGKTRLTVQTRGTAVVDYAVAHLQGMEMGWTMSIDKLQAFLANAAVGSTGRPGRGD